MILKLVLPHSYVNLHHQVAVNETIYIKLDVNEFSSISTGIVKDIDSELLPFAMDMLRDLKFPLQVVGVCCLPELFHNHQ